MLFSAGTALQLEKHIQRHLGSQENPDNTTYFPIKTEATAGKRTESAELGEGPAALMLAAFCPGPAGWGRWGVRAEHIALGRLLGITRGATGPLRTRGNISGRGTMILCQHVTAAQEALLGGGNFGYGSLCARVGWSYARTELKMAVALVGACGLLWQLVFGLPH